MMRFRYITISLILVSGLILVFFLLYSGQREQTSVLSIKQKTSSGPLGIKGMSYSTYNDGKLIAKLDVDELKVRKRKFWIFNVRPLNEAILTNVTLEYHHYKHADIPSKMDLLASTESLLSVDEKGRSTTGTGLITRGIIDGLEIQMYKADRLLMVAKANKAYINFKKKRINMKGVTLDDVSAGKLIRSRTAVWDNETGILRIPGEYIVETSDGITVGKKMYVDLGFTEKKE